MTSTLVDLSSLKCVISNKPMRDCLESAPYLFACSGSAWYGGHELVKYIEEGRSPLIQKVQLFTALAWGTFFIGTVESCHLTPLYFNASKDTIKREPNDEVVLTALKYHWKAGTDVFRSIRGEADINTRLAFLIGQILILSSDKREIGKGLVHLTVCAERLGDKKAALIAGQALLKGLGGESAAREQTARNLLAMVSLEELDDDTILHLAKSHHSCGNYQTSISLFYGLAKKGHPVGCYEYAKRLPRGEGEKEPYRWFLKAAPPENPYPPAAFEAAMILMRQADRKNDQLQRDLFLQAATGGISEGAYRAAMMCKEGVGGNLDLDLAETLFIASAKEKGGDAHHQIGLIYIERSREALKLARRHLQQAIDYGHEGAVKDLVLLSESEKESASSKSGGSSAKYSPQTSSRKKTLLTVSQDDLEGVHRSISSEII